MVKFSPIPERPARRRNRRRGFRLRAGTVRRWSANPEKRQPGRFMLQGSISRPVLFCY